MIFAISREPSTVPLMQISRNMVFSKSKNLRNVRTLYTYTAIPYRASTGPEQGFPCVVFPHREKPVFISCDPSYEIGFSLLEILHRENPVLITGMGLQCSDAYSILY